MKYLAASALLLALAFQAALAAKPPIEGDTTAATRLRFEMKQAEMNERGSSERLQLERERLQLERDRLAFDRQKHADSRGSEWIQAASVAVPLLVGALTLLIGVRNQANQAKLQFELKAAEVVADAGGPHGMRSRALSLRALFPDRLRSDFAEAFDPKLTLVAPGESSQHKIVFFESVAPHVKDYEQLASLWQKLFPTDKWPARIVVTADAQSDAT